MTFQNENEVVTTHKAVEPVVEALKEETAIQIEKFEIEYQSDRFKLKNDEELDDEKLKKLRRIVAAVLSKEKLLDVEPPRQFDSQIIKRSFAERLKQEYLNEDESLTIDDIENLQEHRLSNVFVDPEVSLYGFDTEQVDLIHLFYMLRTEKLLRSVDEVFLLMIVSEVGKILKVKLKKPLHICYTNRFGFSDRSYKLDIVGNKSVHVIYLGVGYQDKILEKISASQEISSDEIADRMSMIVHEVVHAFTSEILEGSAFINESDRVREKIIHELYRVISEGVSLLAERVFLLKIITTLKEKQQDKLADSFRTQLVIAVQQARLMKSNLQEFPQSRQRNAPYVYGWEVIRKMKKLNIEEFVRLLKGVSKDKIKAVGLDDPELAVFTDDPIKWLRDNAAD